MHSIDFLPKHHALLYSSIAQACYEILGDGCIPFLRDVTVAYGNDRGSRMAKKAKADGFELNGLCYLSYSELDVPDELVERSANIIGQHATLTTTKCPWYEAWAEVDLLHYGRIFCEVFDEALADGFHQSVQMKVPCTITTGADRCDFVFLNSNFTEKDQLLLTQRNQELGKRATKSFEYHAGHLYHFVKNELQIAYEDEHERIMTDVLAKFAKYFGEEAAAVVLSYKDHNFQNIDNYANS